MIVVLLVILGIIAGFFIHQAARWEVEERIAGTPAWKSPSKKEQLELEFTSRETWLKLVGGVVLFASAYATFNQMVIAERGQITTRYTEAIKQMGTVDKPSEVDALPLRLGGIYALGQIARTSKEQQDAVIEVLATYIRLKGTRRNEIKSLGPEVVAAASVLFGRKDGVVDYHGRNAPTDLHGAGLVLIRSPKAKLQNANLSGADLRNASLEGADLQNADLTDADLASAELDDANLTGANLAGARLQGADLRGVKGLLVDFYTFAGWDENTKTDILIPDDATSPIP